MQPLQEVENYKNGTDEPSVSENFEIKISEIQTALLDYNIVTKHIKINIYLPNYNELKQYDDLNSNIDWIVMQIVGEIAFRKHIKQIVLAPLPQSTSGLLSLIELPYFIDYLYKIISRVKTRQV